MELLQIHGFDKTGIEGYRNCEIEREQTQVSVDQCFQQSK